MGIWNNLASLAEGVLNGPDDEQRRKQDWQDKNPGAIVESDNSAPWSTEPKDAGEHEQMIAAAQQYGIPVERSAVRENQAMANSVPNASLKRIFNLNGDGGDGDNFQQSMKLPPSDDVQGNVENFAESNAGEPASRTDANTPMPQDTGEPPLKNEDPDPNVRSRQQIEQINTERDKPADIETSRRKRSFWNRLGSGLWNGYKNWNPKESGWGGGIDAIASGFEGAFDPKADAEGRKQRNIGKMWNNLSQDVQLEGIKAKQDYQTAQTKALTANAETRRINANTATDRYELSAGRKTPFKTNGLWFYRLPDGRQEPMLDKDGVQRTELRDVPIATSLNDGTPIFTTGDKAMDREITQGLNEARMEFEAKKLNQADLDRHETEIVKWANDEAERKQKAAKLLFDGKALQQQAAEWDAQSETAIGSEKRGELKAKAVKARSEGESLINQANKSKPLVKPRRPSADIAAPNLSVGTYSEADFVARAKAKGITGDQLKAAIAKAKSDGVIK